MRIIRTAQRLASLALVTLAFGSMLASAKPEAFKPMAEDKRAIGTPVTSVPSVSQIESWLALDNYHIVLQVAAHGTYRLTLPQGCHNLRWAQHVSISGSQNRAWAGFDYLTADGKQCSIGSIERL